MNLTLVKSERPARPRQLGLAELDVMARQARLLRVRTDILVLATDTSFGQRERNLLKDALTSLDEVRL